MSNNSNVHLSNSSHVIARLITYPFVITLGLGCCCFYTIIKSLTILCEIIHGRGEPQRNTRDLPTIEEVTEEENYSSDSNNEEHEEVIDEDGIICTRGELVEECDYQYYESHESSPENIENNDVVRKKKRSQRENNESQRENNESQSEIDLPTYIEVFNQI